MFPVKKYGFYWMVVAFCVIAAVIGVMRRDFELAEKGLVVFGVAIATYQICVFFTERTMFFFGLISLPEERGFRVFSLVAHVICVVIFFAQFAYNAHP